MSTAVVDAPVVRDASGPAGGELTGTVRIARLLLRTHRVGIAASVLGLTAVVYAVASSIPDLFPTAADRAVYAATLGESPGGWAFNGRPYDLDTTGGIVAYEMGFLAMLLLPAVMAVHGVVLTRGEEEAGRSELLTAARIGRRAPLAAAGIVLAGMLVALGVFFAAGLVAAGLPASSSAVYALSLTLHMAWPTGLALVAAQASRTSRGAILLSVGVVLATYLVRAVLDAAGADAAALTPSGWLAEVRAFGPVRWWPLAAMGALAAASVAVAAGLAARRDVGAGLLSERRGARRGGTGLRSALGLAWRLSRGALLGWGAILVVWGLALGVMSREVEAVLDSNPAMSAVFGAGQGNPVVDLGGLLNALLAAACGLQVVSILAREEESGRLGLLLATPVARVRAWGAVVAVAALGTTAVLAAGGVALALTVGVATGDA
ncbi:MAG: ABC transporter, partial [Actinomycetaceae bacterium]